MKITESTSASGSMSGPSVRAPQNSSRAEQTQGNAPLEGRPVKSVSPSPPRLRTLYRSIKSLMSRVVVALTACFGRRKADSDSTAVPSRTTTAGGSLPATEARSSSQETVVSGQESDGIAARSPRPSSEGGPSPQQAIASGHPVLQSDPPSHSGSEPSSLHDPGEPSFKEEAQGSAFVPSAAMSDENKWEDEDDDDDDEDDDDIARSPESSIRDEGEWETIDLDPDLQPVPAWGDESQATLQSLRESREGTQALLLFNAILEEIEPDEDAVGVGAPPGSTDPQQVLASDDDDQATLQSQQQSSPDEGPGLLPDPSNQSLDAQTNPSIVLSRDVQPAQAHDIVRLKQISYDGMAGLFSRGVCSAATTDWFRRIEDGLPTWKHVPGNTPGEPAQIVETVDWASMRPRLQHIQTHGPAGDALFNGYQYMRAEPFTQPSVGSSPETRSVAASEVASATISRAGEQFQQDALQPQPSQNAFFQLDIFLKGRVWGHEMHTIGIHFVRPQSEANAEVHFFDANAREAQIPQAQFPRWLGEHLESRYGSRLTHVMTVSTVERQPIP
jgi:hypothetical protein